MPVFDNQRMLPWLVVMLVAAVYFYIIVSAATILSLLGGGLGGLLAFVVLFGGLAVGWIAFDQARDRFDELP